MKNIESLINPKKIFTSGSGKKFNYSFVPSIANKLFQEYVRLSQSVFQEYKSMLNNKQETYRDILKESLPTIKKAEQANEIGMKITKIVISRNEQDFTWKSDQELEEYILTEMSIDDINNFMMSFCTIQDEEKKS